MAWPTPQDYNEAIQNPRLTFADPELQTGHPELTPLGLPRPITGNFASVYRLGCTRRDWAVRCFWREFADLQERYEAISRHLEAVRLPYTVPFEYVARGIRVRSEWFPVLKMEWIEGELLSDYVGRNLGSPRVLTQLARRWLEMTADLEVAGIAHGDLQHGNVLITGGELKLVDYDGMFVPALAGRGSHELGHQNYQHPLRTGVHFGPELDRFSAWVVYTALIALSRDPGLFSYASDERLLFDRTDFIDAPTSPLMQTLQRHPDPQIRLLAGEMRSMVSVPLQQVPSMREAEVPEASRFRLPRRRAPVRAAPPDTGVRPAWMEEMEAPQADLPGFGSSLAVPRTSTLAAVAGYLACWLVGSAWAAPILDIGLSWVLLTALNLGVLAFWYARHPSVMERRGAIGRERAELRALRAIGREVRRLERERSRLEGRLERRREAHRARLEDQQERVQSKCGRIRADFREVYQSLDGRIQTLQALEQAQLDATLGRLRSRHADKVRRAHRIWEVRDLPPLSRARFWLAGIRTARHLSEARIDELRRRGDKEAAVVLTWRLVVEAEVERDVPRQVPPDLRQPIQERYRRRRRRVEVERQRLELRESAILTAALEVFAEQTAGRRTQMQEIDEGFLQQSADIDREIERVRAPEPVHHWRLAEARRELDRYRAVSLARYALSLVGFRQ